MGDSILTATEAQNRFRNLLKSCHTEPVIITKHNREIAVVMNIWEYHRLLDMDERYWGECSGKAIEDGFMNNDETANWLVEKM